MTQCYLETDMFSIKISTISESLPIKNTDFPLSGIEAIFY